MAVAIKTEISPAVNGRGSRLSSPIKREIQVDDDDDDDKKSIHNLRIESSQKLKRAWEAIYDKFQDSHLSVQDEIYLGRKSVKGDRMRFIRDRGHLRGLPRTSLQFGCFYLDKAELIGCEMKGEDKALNGSETSISPVRIKSEDDLSLDEVEGKASSISESAPTREDPDLQEFLKAEAQRRELCGDEEEESSEDEEAFYNDECDDVFGDDSSFQHCAKWNCEASDSEAEDSGQEEEIRVYSLAHTPSHTDLKEEGDRNKSDQEKASSSLHSSSKERDTPPTSPHSTPLRSRSIHQKSMILKLETPKQSPLKNSRTNKSRSTARKQRMNRVVLPRWEQQQSPSMMKKEMIECTGLTRCSKSLCMICGGFNRASKREEEIV